MVTLLISILEMRKLKMREARHTARAMTLTLIHSPDLFGALREDELPLTLIAGTSLQ